jgi:hypothetical protein
MQRILSFFRNCPKTVVSAPKLPVAPGIHSDSNYIHIKIPKNSEAFSASWEEAGYKKTFDYKSVQQSYKAEFAEAKSNEAINFDPAEKKFADSARDLDSVVSAGGKIVGGTLVAGAAGYDLLNKNAQHPESAVKQTTEGGFPPLDCL